MSNSKKIREMMKNDPTLLEKLEAEIKRLSENGEKEIEDIRAEAIKAVFGVDKTEEEPDQAGTATKLDLDELDEVSGGFLEPEDSTIQVISFDDIPPCTAYRSWKYHYWIVVKEVPTKQFGNFITLPLRECRDCGMKNYKIIG